VEVRSGRRTARIPAYGHVCIPYKTLVRYSTYLPTRAKLWCPPFRHSIPALPGLVVLDVVLLAPSSQLFKEPHQSHHQGVIMRVPRRIVIKRARLPRPVSSEPGNVLSSSSSRSRSSVYPSTPQRFGILPLLSLVFRTKADVTCKHRHAKVEPSSQELDSNQQKGATAISCRRATTSRHLLSDYPSVPTTTDYTYTTALLLRAIELGCGLCLPATRVVSHVGRAENCPTAPVSVGPAELRTAQRKQTLDFIFFAFAKPSIRPSSG